MPDYEFYCRTCSKRFTVHMSVEEHEGQPAECPECRSRTDVERLISHVNVQTSRKSSASR